MASDTHDADDDASLIRRAALGDEHAYAALVRRYAGVAHRTAVLIAGRDEAEDIVQDALLKAYYALARFTPGRPFKPWLLRIVHNTAINHVHASARRDRLITVLSTRYALPVVPDTADVSVSGEIRRNLIRAIEALTEKERLVVTYRYLLELSEQETAEVLQCPVGSVKSRLSRALKHLRSSVPELSVEATDDNR